MQKAGHQDGQQDGKVDFLKNRALAVAGARFLRFWGSKLGAKTDRKSIQKWNPRWNASWHRFFSDFGRFLVPSWGGKSIKNRSKMASKKRLKKEGQQVGKKTILEASALSDLDWRERGAGAARARRRL